MSLMPSSTSFYTGKSIYSFQIASNGLKNACCYTVYYIALRKQAISDIRNSSVLSAI
jgi:hypothetical protein